MRHSISYVLVATGSILLTSGFNSIANRQSILAPEVSDPEYFETVLENDFVKVLNVTVEDGIETGPHAHLRRVVVFVTDCTWRITEDDGSIFEDKHQAGDVFWKEAEIHEKYVDRVNEPCELLEIELK